jgi:hypothetical protein
MSKYFRPWKIDEAQLLPPSVQDYVPSGHLSRFIVALVRESLDLSELSGSYTSGLGQPPFDPRMMTALLLTGYASGIYTGDAYKAQTGDMAKPLPVTEADRGTGVRPNQTGKRLPPVSIARYRSDQGRMGDDLHRPQSHQARQGSMSRLSSIRECYSRAIWTGSYASRRAIDHACSVW